MPSTRDIRRRIKSVKNTAQITKAMQLALTLLVALMTGCASVVPLDGEVRSPKAQIEIFLDGKVPNKPHKIIATFAKRDGPEAETHHHSNFIKQAKKLGADGIIIKAPESGGSSFGPFGGGSQAMFRAVAFVYE